MDINNIVVHEFRTGCVSQHAVRCLAESSPEDAIDFLRGHPHEFAVMDLVADIRRDGSFRQRAIEYAQYETAWSWQAPTDKPEVGQVWENTDDPRGDRHVFVVMTGKDTIIVAPIIPRYNFGDETATESDFLVSDEPTIGADSAVLLSLAMTVPGLSSSWRCLGKMNKKFAVEALAVYANAYGLHLPEYDTALTGGDCPVEKGRKARLRRKAALSTEKSLSLVE